MLSLRCHATTILPRALVLPAALVLSSAYAQEPAQSAADPNEPDARVTQATADAPPPLEDYEASEQISEDLSVSFPVDI